jgi:hypothetical protein
MRRKQVKEETYEPRGGPRTILQREFPLLCDVSHSHECFLYFIQERKHKSHLGNVGLKKRHT